MAQGGVKFLRGQVGDYVTYFLGEDGRGCADHGYYGDGRRWTADREGVTDHGAWTPVQYAAWLSGADPVTGERRGSRLAEGELRTGVRGYEFSVNVPKSASIAAALDTELGRELIAAQERAAQAGLEVLRRRARVRVEGESVAGRRTQQLLEVDALEVAVFSHEGSRDGDPHQHLHVQVGAKAQVNGRWRALAGRQMLACLPEWQAVVGAALATDPGWVRACAARGLIVGPDGAVAGVPREVELALSQRTVAIEARRTELVAAWTIEHGVAPGARAMTWIDQQAWSNTRPKKGEKPLADAEAIARIVAENGGQELLDRIQARRPVPVADVDTVAAVTVAVRLANESELLSESELAAVAARAVGEVGGITDDVAASIEAVRQRLRAQCAAVDLPAGQTGWMPAGVLASAMTVHETLTAMSAAAGPQPGVRALDITGLAPGQAVAAEAVAAGLPCVIEGPAGTGKTTALRAALAARTQAGLATFAVAKSAAAVSQLGEGWTGRDTADGLLVRSGWTREVDGWQPPTPDVAAERPADPRWRGSVLVVDEAAMMDLHTLAALTRHATTVGARVVLVGDDRQLAAVGAAGGFTVAAQGLDVITLTEAQRFTDPGHGDLAAAWRSSPDIGAVVEDVLAAGVVVRHASEAEAHAALAEAAVEPGVIVMAADNDTASTISRLARAERVARGHLQAGTARLGRLEEQIGVGDLIQTRANDRSLGVRNRDRWIVQAIEANGGLSVAAIDEAGRARRDRTVQLPAEYVAAHVHHADAVTVYAAQGATGRAGHALLDDTWTREQAYVALTRGREANVLHVVAEDDGAVRDLLAGVLTHSQRERAEQVAIVTRNRLLAARTEIAPGLADRIAAAWAQTTSRVGAWGSSLFTPQAPAPPAPGPAAGGDGPAI